MHRSGGSSLEGRRGDACAPDRFRAGRWVARALLALSVSVLPLATACAQGLGLRIEAGMTHDDNVMRGRKGGPDLRVDQSYGVNVTKGWNIPVSARTRLSLTAAVGGEKFVRYEGLSRAGYTLGGSFQFRPSGDFMAPTYSAFVRWSADYFDSSLRDGYRLAAGLSVRKPVTDRIQVSLTGQYNRRDGRSTVFDGSDWSGRVNVDYTVFQRDTVYLGAEYRRGDVVSVGTPQLPLIAIAESLVQDDVFTDTTRFAYRLSASTVIATVGYNWPFGSRHSLDLSYRWIRSTPRETSRYYTGEVRYDVNQVSLAYLVRF